MTPNNNDPVTNPTWYGDIRNMFNQRDIHHMGPQGVDLSSYDYVKNHNGLIYQQVATGNMPPGAQWPQYQVDSFFNWMNNGCPKGTPPSQASLSALNRANAAISKATRIRKEITFLSQAELDNLKKAFSGIMAKDTSDLNSYFIQAGYHWLPAPNTYCMHHAPGYNPWHRAYLVSFENALRSVPGCENVTLPYWDITTPFPDILKNAPFDAYTLPEDIGEGYNAGYVTQRYDYSTIQQNLLKYDVNGKISKAMTQTDWEDFHGYFAGAPHNTIIAAHDSSHNSIGPSMADQSVAAFDPVFWFFHANWDRLFWQWQKQMQATNLNGLLSTINKEKDPVSYQTFTDAAVEMLAPFTLNPPKLDTLAIIDSENILDIDYENPQTLTEFTMLPKTKRTSLASEKFSVHTDFVNVRVQGLNRLKIPGSFDVHLLRDGKVIATTGFFQPNEAEKCENCVQNAIVHFDFELPLKDVSEGKLGVWVEPINKNFVGDHFPNKLMGNPTVDVHFLLSNE
ncbi:MAG: tyrosinase family protein [Segetibacter sp.]|nr:tyrosinase family protein [Segetibacter sp.]